MNKKDINSIAEATTEKIISKASSMNSSAKSAEMPKASREKYWSELNVEEKVERMRINVKGMQESIAQLRDDIEFLLQHKHDEHGNIHIIVSTDARYQLRNAHRGLQGMNTTLGNQLTPFGVEANKEVYF